MNARLANQVPIALMSEQDTREANRLRDDITVALETIIHPRHVAKFQPVIGITSSLLYYSLSLLSDGHRTPGQDFCDLDMVRELSGDDINNGSSGPTILFSKLTEGRYFVSAMLMAV